MKTEVIKKLIDKGAIKRETEIEATYKAKDLGGGQLSNSSGSFVIMNAILTGEKITFDTVDTRWGTRQLIHAENVITIDGMDPARFANIFGLNENGDPLKLGKRRGRKPKIKPDIIADIDDDDDDDDEDMVAS